jgi:hypothetical protein
MLGDGMVGKRKKEGPFSSFLLSLPLEAFSEETLHFSSFPELALHCSLGQNKS